MRSDLVSSLPLVLDPEQNLPIPAQLTTQIRDLVARRILSPGDHIPSTRSLAKQLGVSRGSVVTAYDQLAAEGYIVTTHGSGTTINPRLHLLKPKELEVSTPPAPQAPKRPSGLRMVSLDPGVPDTSTLIDSAWRASWRAASSNPPAQRPAQGLMDLRVEIAEHLRRMRGLITDPSRIIVTAGAREGLTLLLRTFNDTARIGVESPGYPSLRRVPQVLGYDIVDLPTDASGLVVENLPTNLDAVLVTPSHQYPYGGSLPADRRTELVTWAERTNTLLIEDDFDSELRYVGMPLPPLTSLAGEQTVLLGTFSSVISPHISCGYLVAPPALAPRLNELRSVLGQPVSAITQAAVANFLDTGALRRRTQRLRRVYRRRRTTVQAAFTDVDGAELRPISGGLHAVLICHKPADAVVSELNTRGIAVTALSKYWGGSSHAENGIVFGFGSHDDDTLEWALAEIADATGLQ
ncbi:PLP-dependent aminotransferase family protein [Corynebacterium sp.]|uniref:MocR-like pyridoxine biosynthesis transcription factor PdxR n=1 Tax=Corynebacterium sp. TaxID=1720 RepID=UPI0028B0001C|nr:PLP-dependent aminotransferase family protein [Corynebacterium sp.]